MAADITQPPVQIGLISGASGQVENFGDFPTCVTASGSFGGPFRIGAAIYQLQVTSVGSPVKIRCYKSTDEGLTWAEQFAGGAPVVDPTNGPLIMQAALLPLSQTILVGYYAETGPTLGLQFATFVPGVGWSAGSFPTISADLRVSLGGDLLQSDFAISPRSDDSVVLTYGNTDGANWNTVFRISSGGPWGSATVIAVDGGSAPPGTITLPNWLFPQAVVDGSDNVLGFLRQIDTAHRKVFGNVPQNVGQLESDPEFWR